MITGNNLTIVDQCIASLKSKYDMTDLGLMHYYLGMQIYQHEDCTYLSQSKYVTDILQRFDMVDCKPLSIPLSLGVQLQVSKSLS